MSAHKWLFLFTDIYRFLPIFTGAIFLILSVLCAKYIIFIFASETTLLIIPRGGWMMKKKYYGYSLLKQTTTIGFFNVYPFSLLLCQAWPYSKEGSVGTSNGVLGFDSLPTTRSDKIIPQKRKCPSR